MAAEESRGDIERCLEGAGLLVLVAGLSGGTGWCHAVIARIAKEMGITTVAFVSTPDAFEGPVRARQTQKGLAKLREQVEALNVIPNRLAFQGRGDYETMLKNFDAYFRVTNAFNARVVAGYISALKAA
jgi:cell division protein FtsZ